MVKKTVPEKMIKEFGILTIILLLVLTLVISLLSGILVWQVLCPKLSSSIDCGASLLMFPLILLLFPLVFQTLYKSYVSFSHKDVVMIALVSLALTLLLWSPSINPTLPCPEGEVCTDPTFALVLRSSVLFFLTMFCWLSFVYVNLRYRVKKPK